MAALILIAIWVGIITWVATAASRKGRSPAFWGLAGALLGLFAFIPLMIAGTSKRGRFDAIREEEIARAQIRAELAQPAPDLPVAGDDGGR